MWRLYKMQENFSAAGAVPRTQLRELTALPTNPGGGREGLVVPSSRTPLPPLSAIWTSSFGPRT